MPYRTNEAGFSVFELVMVIAIVAILGLAGYSIYSRQNAKTTNGSSTSQASNSATAKANDVASSPNIRTTSDLDKAAATLDQTDPGGSNNTDANQLDSQLANF